MENKLIGGAIMLAATIVGIARKFAGKPPSILLLLLGGIGAMVFVS